MWNYNWTMWRNNQVILTCGTATEQCGKIIKSSPHVEPQFNNVAKQSSNPHICNRDWTMWWNIQVIPVWGTATEQCGEIIKSFLHGTSKFITKKCLWTEKQLWLPTHHATSLISLIKRFIKWINLPVIKLVYCLLLRLILSYVSQMFRKTREDQVIQSYKK